MLINGAGGGVGTFAIQIAKQLQAVVTAVDRGDKLAALHRLGADEVHIIYRRSRTEMLAEPEEVEEAEKEGIKIHFLVAPVRISEKDGGTDGIECIRTRLTAADTTGRRKPIPIADSEFFIEADYIIPAIGQEPDLGNLAKVQGLKVSKWNLLEVNPETLQTNIPHIFAGGDVISGTATVI